MRKRLNKIYPLFFLTLVLVTILEYIYKSKVGETFVYPNFDLYHLFLNVILCQNGLFATEWSFNSPSWCISICFILYVIFFIVLYHSKNMKEVTYKFVGLAIFGAMLLLLKWEYPVFNSLVARGLVCFSIGIRLAYSLKNEHLFNTRFIGYASLFLLLAFYIIFRRTPDVVGNVNMLFIFCIAPLIIQCVLFVPWLNKLLSFRFFTFLGSLSMEIYLFHFIVQCAIKNIDVYYNLGLNYSSKKIWFLYVFATILVSILYKLLFEKKCNNLFVKICDRCILKRK